GALLTNYPAIAENEPRLLMIEAKERLLSGWNPEMSDIAERRLREEKIDLRLATAVSHVSDEGITFGSGETINCATVVWSAGVRAEPLVNSLPGEKGRDGRIRVNTTMELPEYPGVFVVGDAAAVTPPGEPRPLPPTAPVAMSGGAQAGENAVRRLLQKPLRQLQYTPKGDLVSLGRGAAAADIFGRVFDGAVGWVLRRGVYLVNLIGFRNRLFVVMDWAFVTFHQRVIASFGAYRKPKILTREFPAEQPAVGQPAQTKKRKAA
ncbi:MAG TPA: FAD-dependent oxidoreductase, partial [Chloroflexota bacterium]|nr:FAD-dependent oxidoreductase [Chloroflexota bacterium]